MLGEASVGVRVLVPELATVSCDDEIALAAGLFVDGCAGVRGFDGGGQTGRRRQVVSNYAVFDRDVHDCSLGQAQSGFRGANASATHPAMNASPPIGVIGPSQRMSARARP